MSVRRSSDHLGSAMRDCEPSCQLCANTCSAINASAAAAGNAVFEYAARFDRREDYEPLEALALHVQRRAVQAGVAATASGSWAQRLHRVAHGLGRFTARVDTGGSR